MVMMKCVVLLIIVMGCIHYTAEAYGGVANYNEEPKVIRVDGKVLCQDCTQDWNKWVHGARPIIGGKVSVTCMNERSRIVYYGSDLTDEQGQFDMTINKYTVNGKELKANLCRLRLVSSADDTCNVLTDSGGGRSGVNLGRRPSVVFRDLVRYTVGPFYYTTPMCEQPDTHDQSEDNGQGYHSPNY